MLLSLFLHDGHVKVELAVAHEKREDHKGQTQRERQDDHEAAPAVFVRRRLGD